MTQPLHLVLDHARRYTQAAVDCEAAVFGEWYGETPEELAEQYTPWEDVGVFLVLADDAGEVHAAARLLPPSPVGLLTLRDVGVAPWSVDRDRCVRAAGLDLTSTWDIATLATRRRRPGGPNLAAGLLHGLVRTSTTNGVTGLLAVLDDRVRRLLGAVGLQTHALPGTSPQPYYGSASSTPVHVRVGPALDRQRRIMPDVHRLITLGIGLDGIDVAPPASFVLPTASADLRTLVPPRPRVEAEDLQDAVLAS